MWHKCKNDDDAKKLFRKLALRLHADHGGSDELMILLTESYEMRKGSKTNSSSEKIYRKKQKEPTVNTVWKKGDCYEKVVDDVSAYDEMFLSLTKEITSYAKENEKFKMDYIESILEYAQKNQRVTSNQFNSLVKVYYSFRMNEKKEKK